MDTQGIVLAGGAATRLPHKPLLPLKNGQPVITSSLEMMRLSGIKNVVIVVPPNSVIPDILGTCWNGVALDYSVQPALTGVPHAMTYGLRGRGDYLVSCCDNVYEDIIFSSEHLTAPTVMLRTEPAWKAQHLAKFTGNHFAAKGFTSLCVAGWWYLQSRDIRMAEENESTVDFLNRVQARGWPVNDGRWWDVGTQETYTGYWRCD